ncbi:MAG: hypothetical protein R2832_00465 [Rhodothermales bacterium]
MIYLILTVLCILGFGVLFKLAALRFVDGLSLVTVNYVVAAAIVALSHPTSLEVYASTPALTALGAGTGALFIGGFVLFATSTRIAGMSLSLSVMRVSVVIPFVYSWLVWNETPSAWQTVGLVLACLAFFLITRQSGHVTATSDPHGEGGESKTWSVTAAALSLLFLFVTGGLTDVSMKTFDEVFSADHSRWHFMTVVFGTAAVIGLVSMLILGRFRRSVLTNDTLRLGFVLGIVNIGSVEFLLRAIHLLNGTFVFPAVNISVVAGAALLGVIVWKERLSGFNRLGIAVAVAALLLLGN